LPKDLHGLRLKICYRSYQLTLDIARDRLGVTFRQGWAKTAKIGFRDQVYAFEAGDIREVAL
jgi:hypothetical protein